MYFRPISILPNFCKIFGSIVHKYIHYNVWSTSQHGFLRKRSTETNLVFSQYVRESLNDQLKVDTIYMDMQKTKLTFTCMLINHI